MIRLPLFELGWEGGKRLRRSWTREGFMVSFAIVVLALLAAVLVDVAVAVAAGPDLGCAIGGVDVAERDVERVRKGIQRVRGVDVAVDWLAAFGLQGGVAVGVMAYQVGSKDVLEDGECGGVGPDVVEHHGQIKGRCLVHVPGFFAEVEVMVWVLGDMLCFRSEDCL